MRWFERGLSDEALAHTFEHYTVDPSRVAIGGFSDGASYALSLGLGNGDLFRHIIAFSPGFAVPPRQLGSPRIFMSHGTKDRVLPIVPEEMMREAVHWWVEGTVH